MATYTYSQTYTQTHSIVFLADNLRNAIRDIIRENGLKPNSLMQDWADIERGVRTWLESGHLSAVTIEFFRPGSSQSSARWDFPIKYDGSGVPDDMWSDKDYLRQLIAKSARPPSDCVYRIILSVKPNAPTVSGFTNCEFLGTALLSARQAGTVIATRHMTAGVTYWR